MIENKTCLKCGIEKPLIEFYKNKHKPTHELCKQCEIEIAKDDWKGKSGSSKHGKNQPDFQWT
jgi:hypothetical protein